MKTPKFFKLFACMGVALFLLLQFNAQAHINKNLTETNPEAGTTIRVPPTYIELVFVADVTLIKFKVTGSDEIPTKFTPNSEAMAKYQIETPDMKAGEFMVELAIISADGHVVVDSFGFLVDPDATEK